MKRGIILAFILLTLFSNIIFVSAQATDSTQTPKKGFMNSLTDWISNFGNMFFEDMRESAGKFFDYITPASQSSSSSSSSSSTQGGVAFGQLQSGGF